MNKALLSTLLLLPVGAVAKPCLEPAPQPRTPCSPRIEQRDDILVLIDDTVKAYNDWRDAVELERTLRSSINLRKSSNLKAWAESRADVDDAKNTLEKKFQETVAATERDFRVGPNSRTGPIQSGLFKTDTAVWKPALGVDEEFYEVKRKNKPTVYLRFANTTTAKTVDLAQTLDNGKVVVSIHALQHAARMRSPASLAAVLEHEGVHFDQLTGPGGMKGSAAIETAAYKRTLAVADDIGLGQRDRDDAHLQIKRRSFAVAFQAIEEHFSGKPYRAAPGSDDYPHVPAPDTYFQAWEKYRDRLAAIEKQQKKLANRLPGRPEEPDSLRDSLNDRRPPEGAMTDDGCGIPGFWAGDIYVPPTPCARTLPQPTETGAVPAVPVPSVPGATLPPPIRAIVSLSALAERICANPAQAHSQAFHDDYKNSWINPNDDPSAMPKCRGEVFLVLKRITRERSPDYNSDYFQSLAESLNAPLPTAFVPPEPEVDYPVPYGPGVPDCLRAEGRRCIRWR